jgi:hypothetical protein
MSYVVIQLKIPHSITEMTAVNGADYDATGSRNPTYSKIVSVYDSNAQSILNNTGIFYSVYKTIGRGRYSTVYEGNT